jgi:hypothetical protein
MAAASTSVATTLNRVLYTVAVAMAKCIVACRVAPGVTGRIA